MHSKCLDFFSFKFWVGVAGGGGERIFFLLSFVPNMFILSSHQVPNLFPKGVPNNTLF